LIPALIIVKYNSPAVILCVKEQYYFNTQMLYLVIIKKLAVHK